MTTLLESAWFAKIVVALFTGVDDRTDFLDSAAIVATVGIGRNFASERVVLVVNGASDGVDREVGGVGFVDGFVVARTTNSVFVDTADGAVLAEVFGGVDTIQAHVTVEGGTCRVFGSEDVVTNRAADGGALEAEVTFAVGVGAVEVSFS